MALTNLRDFSPDDKAFFLDIYEKFKRIMYHTVRKYVSNENDVEDLVQDAIVKLIPKTSVMRDLNHRALGAYIVVTVRNVSINYLKHQQITSQNYIDDELEMQLEAEYQMHSPTPEEVVLINEKRDEFYRVWEKLLGRDRDVLMGKYVLGLTDKELADIHGCKPCSIRMVLTRARRSALEVLKDEAYGYDNT